VRGAAYTGAIGGEVVPLNAPAAPGLLSLAAVLSPDLLASNIAALTRAQGRCPTLGALPDFLRVATVRNHVQVTRRGSDERWHDVDAPSDATGLPSWVAESAAREAPQVILVGVGLGYALPPLASLAYQRVVAIEPHPGLATLLLSRTDWAPWFAGGRLRLLTGPDYAGAADLARFLDGLRDIAVVVHPTRARVEPEVMAGAEAVARQMVQNAHANGNARRRFAGPYLLQTLGNLRAIADAPDVHALDGIGVGHAAVVVGAGPSLDRNGPELAALQDRAIILTADTAAAPLAAHGVRPHIAVSVDSSALNAQHLTAIPDPHDIALAAEGSIHPAGLAAFAGRSFTFRVSNHEPWPWLRRAGVHRGEVTTWGSVLTSTFVLARRLGCDPIVFIGSDLAYTGMRPYCRGTIYDAMWQEWIDRGCSWEALMEEYFSRQPEILTRDVHGDTTRTAPHLLSFRDWLVEQTATAPQGRFINATGAGILHGGRLEQIALREALGPRAPMTDVRAAIAARHAAALAGSRDANRVASLMADARARPEGLPLKQWIDFTASTVSDAQILDAMAG
jgi:hypothetical protein